MIKIAYDNTIGEGDLATNEDGSIDDTGGMETSVLISVLTDARDITAPPGLQRVGWYGDVYSVKAGDVIGSLLHLIERESTSLAIQKRAKDYIEESLRWMLQLDAAKTVVVQVQRLAPNMLAFKATITKSNGQIWQDTWELTL